MKLEQQVTSLEISQRLAALGVNKESYFGWSEDPNEPGILFISEDPKRWGYLYLSYTVAELGEMLPVNSTVEHCRYPREGECTAMTWKDTKETHREYGDTEANARGLLLCYLLEQNLISLTDINK